MAVDVSEPQGTTAGPPVSWSVQMRKNFPVAVKKSADMDCNGSSCWLGRMIWHGLPAWMILVISVSILGQ